MPCTRIGAITPITFCAPDQSAAGPPGNDAISASSIMPVTWTLALSIGWPSASSDAIVASTHAARSGRDRGVVADPDPGRDQPC